MKIPLASIKNSSSICKGSNWFGDFQKHAPLFWHQHAFHHPRYLACTVYDFCWKITYPLDSNPSLLLLCWFQMNQVGECTKSHRKTKSLFLHYTVICQHSQGRRCTTQVPRLKPKPIGWATNKSTQSEQVKNSTDRKQVKLPVFNFIFQGMMNHDEEFYMTIFGSYIYDQVARNQ